MEAVVLHGSVDQSISPYKSSHLRNSKKFQHPIISSPSEIVFPSHFNTAGLLQAPPRFLSQSYPPYSLQQSPQPPLLPLPTANPRRSAATRGLSCLPANKKTSNGNKTKSDPSLTPKKSKSPKKEEKNSPKKSIHFSLTTPSGPDPKELPRNVTKVLPLISSSGFIHSNASKCVNDNSLSSAKAVEDQVDIFSGAVAFTVSPPPSSLPLPTFSLRPKLSCKAEAAAGIDTGATDDLRRLLRLR